MPNIELASFRLKPGVTHEQLLEASAAMNDGFLAKQPGWLSRQLLHVKDNHYMDLVSCNTYDDAQKAIQGANNFEEASAYFALMDMAEFNPDKDMVHADVLAAY